MTASETNREKLKTYSTACKKNCSISIITKVLIFSVLTLKNTIALY